MQYTVKYSRSGALYIKHFEANDDMDAAMKVARNVDVVLNEEKIKQENADRASQGLGPLTVDDIIDIWLGNSTSYFYNREQPYHLSCNTEDRLIFSHGEPDEYEETVNW